jgi:hypothetical protein
MNLLFQVVKVEGRRNELVATASNLAIAMAAFDTSAALCQDSRFELRHGARVIRRANEQLRMDSN